MIRSSNRHAQRDPLASFFRPEESVGVSEFENARLIDVNLLDPNPFQPRKSPDQTSLAELADSIRQVGILQPLIVRQVGDRYQIVGGERRWRAAIQINLAQVPCVIRNVTDDDMETLALLENIQREDLNPVDEAHSYRRLMERFGLSLREMAGRIQRSHEYIAQRLRLIEVPELEDAVSNGKINPTVAQKIAQVDDPTARQNLIDRANRGERIRVRDFSTSRSNPVSRPHSGLSTQEASDRKSDLDISSQTFDTPRVSDNLTVVADEPKDGSPEPGVSNYLTATAHLNAVDSPAEITSPQEIDDAIFAEIGALRRALTESQIPADSGRRMRFIIELEGLIDSAHAVVEKMKSPRS